MLSMKPEKPGLGAGEGVSAGNAISPASSSTPQQRDLVSDLSAPSHALAWLEVDLDSVVWNLERIAEHVGEGGIIAVVKNDAYGHGAAAVAKVLVEKGVRSLAVARVREALALRRSGIEAEVLNMGFFTLAEAEDIVAYDITQALFRLPDALALAGAAVGVGRKAGVHIKVDTGLGRLGVPHGEAIQFVERVHGLEGLRITGLFSVLTEDPDFDRVQLSRLLTVARALEERGIDVGIRHIASSAAILDTPEAFLDVVRPGIMLYGLYPSRRAAQERRIELRPAMSLKARVGTVRPLPAGEGVSYHRRYVARRDTRIATLPIGWGDGYPKGTPSDGASSGGEVLIHRRRYPIVGDVCANVCMVDVGDGEEVQIGDEVVLMGRQGNEEITADEIAARAGGPTSNYDVVTGFRSSLPRIYQRQVSRERDT